MLLFDVEPSCIPEGYSEEEIGDLVAATTADRLLGALRDGESVGRLTRTRFAVLLRALSRGSASAVARRILEVMGEPVTLPAQTVALRVRSSVVTSSGGHGLEYLLEHAEPELTARSSSDTRPDSPSDDPGAEEPGWEMERRGSKGCCGR